MNPITASTIVLLLVGAATTLGLILRAGAGRIRSVADAGHPIVLDGVTWGTGATLLQFSTEVCAPCSAMHGMLQHVAEEFEGVRHVDIDLTRRPELAGRFGILQTPTTFILDRNGVIHSRIGGVARQDAVRTELVSLLPATITAAS